MSETKRLLSDRLLSGPALFGAWVILGEAFLVFGYLQASPIQVTDPRYVVYPFIWINVAIWAIYTTNTDVGSRRHRLVGTVVAAAYYLVLLAVSGNIAFVSRTAIALGINPAMPGWGPVITGALPGLELQLVPFETIGYAGLSYLLYANVLDVSRGLLAGALGVFTCISCTVPLWGPVLGLLGGPLASLSGTATAFSYDIGTVVFLFTVFLLWYSHNRTRPAVPFPGGRS
ncbi:MAG: hypothetical protein ABEJ58_04490 [Halodesulfurarchaeum sp.]